MRHPLEREREGDDAAAVSAVSSRLRLDLGGLGVNLWQACWTGCSGKR